ncbi:YajQ family cyclic di-GMP-binding protein [Candidatus Contubernalis alkaliaceticus]|uniref:YajQ family cyclic di-GMP-binding protein n=1 Tax=Candidatus Contubernalis alkaliaceticus TaxID=338645 RepID=UPI001F4C5201|nr:YajQ family cyclic di-GMP-binding protein [Candidatus Contubernalis alkalaceticus]UNC90642.1 YajQ family cyclic di-GMP-binding protein [Candidatus Contubernalis alkalaceticus]
MAKDESFDVVSKIDMQEVDNAVNQTTKEIQQRYDFKNSKSTVSVEDETIKIISDSENKLRSVIDVLQTKMIRRKVPIRNLDYGKVEDASGGLVRQFIRLKQGIESETARKMVKDIKGLKLKVQVQIMDDQLRVSGKKRDDLQAVIVFLKEQNYQLDLQFINYR